MGTSRYDTVADWYLGWSETWSAGFVCDRNVGLIPDRLEGERWLDAACGAGRTSRELARRGAEVVAIDLSARLIEAARGEEAVDALGVSYRRTDIASPEDWWDLRAFDGAVCEMALMDIDDLDGTIAAVARVLRPGGLFCLSMVHPCRPSNEAGLSSWPPDSGYHTEGFWTSPDHNPDGARIRVGSNHRTLATYLNTLLDHGFVAERVHEPVAPVPTWLVLALRRA